MRAAFGVGVLAHVLMGCCATPPETAVTPAAPDVEAVTPAESGRRAAASALITGRPTIRYTGFPSGPAIDAETGLPRECVGCLVWPGQVAEIQAYNAEMRRAAAAGEVVVR